MSFSFGTPSSAPASSGLTGFNFGANKPATPGLGLAAPTQPATGFFGSPATSTSAFGTTPAFGAPTANTSFGAPAANTSFGGINPTPAQNPPPAFGATGTPSFGAATTGFGATSVAPFGSTTTPSFGATTTPGFGAVATSFGTTPAFGTTTTPSFGTTPVPSFGANTSVPTLGSSLGTGGLNFGPGTNTTQSSAGFFAPPASTSAGLGGLGGFNFGKTATTTQSSFNKPIGFGATTTVSSALPATTATPSFGLGGAGGIASSAGIGANTTTNDGKEEPPKQTKLPNEISTTVDSFKEFVKKQKSLSSDIMRVSIKPLNKVSRDVDVLMRQTLSLQTKVWSCRAHARRLRSAAASALTAADTPYAPSDGDLEGACPPAYVVQLIEELEAQLATFRRQMDVADKQLQAEPKLLTEQEITLGIRRMHESLVALAGRLQAVHTQVEAQKEQYLNLRKYVLKDPTNVFEIPTANSSLDQILRDTETSRKKSKTGLSDVNVSSAVLSDPKAALGNIQQLAGPTPFSYIANTLSPFPNTDSNTNWQPPQPQPAAAPPTLATPLMTGFTEPGTLQLQKPPGKRGKQ